MAGAAWPLTPADGKQTSSQSTIRAEHSSRKKGPNGREGKPRQVVRISKWSGKTGINETTMRLDFVKPII